MSLPIPAMGTPVMGYNSTAHRVMSIPELLELVFGHLDRQSNAANACVSKTWNHIALDTIWREVDDIRLLFSYLDTLIQPYPGSPLVSIKPPYPYVAKTEYRHLKQGSTQARGQGLHLMHAASDDFSTMKSTMIQSSLLLYLTRRGRKSPRRVRLLAFCQTSKNLHGGREIGEINSSQSCL